MSNIYGYIIYMIGLEYVIYLMHIADGLNVSDINGYIKYKKNLQLLDDIQNNQFDDDQM